MAYTVVRVFQWQRYLSREFSKSEVKLILAVIKFRELKQYIRDEFIEMNNS